MRESFSGNVQGSPPDLINKNRACRLR